MQAITFEKLNQMREAFLADNEKKVRSTAVTSVGIQAAAANYQAVVNTPNTFSIELKTGEVCNQKASGRCWLFATMNVMRFEVMKKLNLETFELSQNYMFFYDKLEKANYFLENILSTLDEPLDGRMLAYLLAMPFNDGGQWDMAVALVEKYGVVPKSVMPDTFHASSSGGMVKFLTLKAREFAKELRDGYKAGKTMEELRARKEEMVGTFYDMLSISLGVPPTAFDFEVRDKDDKFIRDMNITPKAFFDKYVGKCLDEYISVINAPTADKPYHRSYTVRFLGNVKEGQIVRYVNLPIDELKRAAIAQLKAGKPVWFGCDVGKSSVREQGVMAMNAYALEDLLDTDFPMTKAQRLDYGQSLMTHAMVFMGVDLDEAGNPVRWCVENSWGDEPGDKGYYVMTDDWFNEYMYQIVIHKKYLSDEILREYAAEPIVLQPWDPMGSLAD